jgi:hypothetical protein
MPQIRNENIAAIFRMMLRSDKSWNQFFIKSEGFSLRLNKKNRPDYSGRWQVKVCQ